jgi:hypothetical protein
MKGMTEKQRLFSRHTNCLVLKRSSWRMIINILVNSLAGSLKSHHRESGAEGRF